VADDGSYETSASLNNQTSQFAAVWINRFAPPPGTGAYTIDSISIDWPNAATAAGDLSGKSIDLVAYYDADADGNPSNAVRLGSDDVIMIGGPDVFENYSTDFSVPGDGDVYIGFVDAFASGGVSPILFPAALDSSGDPAVGWVSGKSTSADADINTLANNDLTGTISNLSNGALAGVWMIRSTASLGGSGGPCSGPLVTWLTAAPASGSVDGGTSVDVVITADPGAANLAAGTYAAALCLTTNDPANAVIAVPVNLTVTPGDAIFCSSFENSETGSCGSGGGVPGVYTDKASFLANAPANSYEEDFASVLPDLGQDPLSFSGGGITYTVYSSTPYNPDGAPGGLYNPPGAISTVSARDRIVITVTSGNLTAIGGNFWASNVDFSPTGTRVTLVLADGTTETWESPGPLGFRGFVTSAPISSMTIDAPEDIPDNPPYYWATMDNLIVGGEAN
jgi:hypothetical protein